MHGLVASTLAMLLCGAIVVIPARFSASRFWADVQRYTVTWYDDLHHRPDSAHGHGQDPTSRRGGGVCGAMTPASPLPVAVVGAGAIGAYVGAAPARGGGDVVLIARGAHLRAMQEHGVRVLSPCGDLTQPTATDDLTPCRAPTSCSSPWWRPGAAWSWTASPGP
jgi:hypothetical protein